MLRVPKYVDSALHAPTILSSHERHAYVRSHGYTYIIIRYTLYHISSKDVCVGVRILYGAAMQFQI